MVSLEKNQACSLVRLPARKKASQSLWMFRVKEEQDGRKRYKARLVVKGFQQIHRVDYNEIFSLVVKMTTIRLVLSIVASEDLHLEQLDVKTAFLHGDLDEDIYMTQSEGFRSDGKEENLVCKLKKSLYGLKQAPRQWVLIFVEDSWNEEPCSDVHQVGEREVEVLRSFNWPSRELITEDGVLPERGIQTKGSKESVIQCAGQQLQNVIPSASHRYHFYDASKIVHVEVKGKLKSSRLKIEPHYVISFHLEVPHEGL
ncbi:putative RNA-directed DNA polymerase [Tanacetum coccineum]